MAERIDLPCVVLASGEAQRFGAPKGLALLCDRPLIQHVVDRLRLQLCGPIMINCDADSAYKSFGDGYVEDQLAGGLGPLAGIQAALKWAQQNESKRILTVSIDTPFLPGNFAERLVEVGAPSVGASGGRIHPVCGLWSTSLEAHLRSYLIAGRRKTLDWVQEVGATVVDFSAPEDPFFNINTKADLTVAEDRLCASREE